MIMTSIAGKFIRDLRRIAFLSCSIAVLVGCAGIESPITPPEHVCEGVVEHYPCAKHIEATWLTRLPESVARQGAELVLKLKDGRTISRIDTPGHFEGHHDSAGNSSTKFTFYDHIENLGYYVIERHYYEGGGFEFINIESGKTVTVNGAIEISPDRTRFLAVNIDEQSDAKAQQIEAWTISSARITKEWAYSQRGLLCVTARWSNSRTINVYDYECGDERGKYLQRISARFQNESGAWKVSTYAR